MKMFIAIILFVAGWPAYLACYRNIQIWFNFRFRNKICYPLIKHHVGVFVLTVIDSVQWYWCKISDETKPKYYWKYFIKYPPVVITDSSSKTREELIIHN